MQFHIGGNIIECAESYKYLGVVLDEFINFENTTNVIVLSGGMALGAIIGKFRDIQNMGFETFTQLFERCVTSIMEYGSPCWGFKQFSKYDNVLNSDIRFFLGVHRFTPIPFLYSEMLWQCTRYRQWLNMIRYWNHIIAMDNQRLTKRVFLNDYLLKRGNWSKEISEIFHKLDLNSVFTDMHECPLKIIQDKLHKVFLKIWNMILITDPNYEFSNIQQWQITYRNI